MQPLSRGGKLRPIMVISALVSLGCGESASIESFRAENPTTVSAPLPGPISPDGIATSEMPGMGMMGGMGQVDQAAIPTGIPNAATTGRKIIYNARLDLVTEDLGKFESSLIKLVDTAKAYVADSDRSGSAGITRMGTWKVRVPVQSFDAFLKNAVGLGELVAIKTDSQDVSEEFFDLEARQTAKKVEETRLLKHLVDSTGKLEDILAVERELSRVRSEIERMQGRLRVIANLTELATVTISAREIKGYVPPQAPTFVTRMSRRFGNSVDSVREFGESLLLMLIGLIPWLPLLIPGIGIGLWGIRSVRRRRSQASR